MDERMMQFRIGMFVIVAGLVLTMLLVWFGEGPSLFREHRYLIVRYDQAPGVSVGIPVRKSGIRIGEVVTIEFDDRPDQPDGVLVTMSLEAKFPLREGSVPRITRGLIGDVWIDMLPGDGDGTLATARNPAAARDQIIAGAISPDPANALAAATEAFQNVKGTLTAIEEAATGLRAVTDRAENLDEFLSSFRDMGRRVASLAERLEGVVEENRDSIGPAISSLRGVAEKLDATLDAETQAAIRTAAQNLSSGSARLDRVLADVAPLAADLGGGATRAPTTSAGQTVARINRIASEIGLLTRQLSDGRGGLNSNGSLQRLVMSPDLYNNLNSMTNGAGRVVTLAERTLTNLNRFAERIANDPAAISRGALQR